MHPYPVITVGAAGALVTSGAASAEVAIPDTADGETAKVVRIASTALAHVKPVLTGTAATANDTLVGPGDAVYLHVQGYTHVAYIQQTAAAKIQISPVES